MGLGSSRLTKSLHELFGSGSHSSSDKGVTLSPSGAGRAPFPGDIYFLHSRRQEGQGALLALVVVT